MGKEPIRMAIAYDFDGTLAPGNMQEHSFLPEVGIEDPKSFWNEVGEFAIKHDMDGILAYMHLMLKKAHAKGKQITKEDLLGHGTRIESDPGFFPGVVNDSGPDWFERVNEYAARHGIKMEHYIVSSGIKEIVEGTSLKNKFTHIFASSFLYEKQEAGSDEEFACWPALAINYTTKTQYLFRINKGIDNAHDNKSLNEFTPDDERRVPFPHMIYIGDGETDIPCMKMIKGRGGHAIAVYDPARKEELEEEVGKLVKQERAHFAVPADYSQGTKLDQIIKVIIKRVGMTDEDFTDLPIYGPSCIEELENKLMDEENLADVPNYGPSDFEEFEEIGDDE